ncbi:hypothetical protein [Thermus hydrothermalis]|uniref:hypothetical protein n=1 Tax=Thermus hydrothermalis TaxID=2908148 RepID=UPI001FAB2C03|nr:hypothetical protein [Thermus hydrothermalis]
MQEFLFGLLLHREGKREAPPPPPGEDLLKELEAYGFLMGGDEGEFRPTSALANFFHAVSGGILQTFVQAGERAQEALEAFARAEESLSWFEDALTKGLLNNALAYLQRHHQTLEELAEFLVRTPESLRQLVRLDVETKLADGKITLAEAWARLGEVQEKAGLILRALERLDGEEDSLAAKSARLQARLPLLLEGLPLEAEGAVRAEMERAERALFRLRTSVKARAARSIDEAIRFFQRLGEGLVRRMQARREIWERLERLAQEGLEGELPLLFAPERPHLLLPADEEWGALRGEWGEVPEEPAPLEVLEPEEVFAEGEEASETLRELEEAFLASPHATLSGFASERGLGETTHTLLALHLYERREELPGLRFDLWSDGWTLWIREVFREEVAGYPEEVAGERAVRP